MRFEAVSGCPKDSFTFKVEGRLLTQATASRVKSFVRFQTSFSIQQLVLELVQGTVFERMVAIKG